MVKFWVDYYGLNSVTKSNYFRFTSINNVLNKLEILQNFGSTVAASYWKVGASTEKINSIYTWAEIV